MADIEVLAASATRVPERFPAQKRRPGLDRDRSVPEFRQWF
jgi:hypothetical protein